MNSSFITLRPECVFVVVCLSVSCFFPRGSVDCSVRRVSEVFDRVHTLVGVCMGPGGKPVAENV